jgi:CPA2 family monovalent cation:H+ antiporter-2
MHGHVLLADFLIILVVALGVAWTFSKLRLPTIVGFLAAGVVLGPGALELVAKKAEIELMAEVGVVLLLFSIGLELSLSELKRLSRFVFGGGILEVVGATAVFGGLAWTLGGFGPGKAVFAGMLAALSSTAIVLTTLRENNQLGSPHGRGMVGVLLFQDLAVAPMLLVVPMLAGAGEGAVALVWTLLEATGLVVTVWLVASYAYPWLAERVVRTRRRELFTLYSVVVAIGTAYAAGVAGLPLELGAFLAGLIISESPYSAQMTAEIEPFKDVFNSLFFVSMGLLVDPALFVTHPVTILGLFVGLIAVKTLLITGIVTGLGYGLRVAVLVGLGICQIGEFSFILAREGMQYDLLTDVEYGLFLSTAVLTMTATPFFLRYSDAVGRLLDDSALRAWVERLGIGERFSQTEPEVEPKDDHVVIVGFGHNGQKLARSLRRFDIAYTIVDLNPTTVREYGDDEPIHYGDATRKTILEHLGIDRARTLIVTAADRRASHRIVDTARHLNPDLYIVARTRMNHDLEELYGAGADQVIVDESETALTLVGQTLEAYDLSPDKILRERDELRREGYWHRDRQTLPDEPRARRTLKFLASSLQTEFVRVPRGGEAAGRTIGDLHIRQEAGATILAVVRDSERIDQPAADFQLREWDQILLVGRSEEIDKARGMLTAG